MPENDAVLLERFSRRGDAEAFTELVRRYARLVYSTSWRLLRHETDAADVTQETFFELTRRADRIVGPLSGWLHRVAVQKSIDVIRRRTHRKHREQTYAETRPVEVQTWHDLSSSVDEALEKLEEPVRHLLLDHFLAGQTMRQIALEHGISQATVSRRINEGLEQLRGTLRRQGLLVGAAALGTMLMENTSQAVPAAVGAALSKMAMVGVPGTTAGVSGQAAVAVSANTVKVVVVAAAVVTTVSVVAYVHHARGPEPPAQSSAPTGIVRPSARGNSSRPASRAATTDKIQADSEVAAVTTLPATDETPMLESVLPPVGPAPDAPRMGGIAVGDPFSGVPTADLRTPEAVVYSFLTLLDQGATDEMRECLAEGAQVPADNPFPRSLGYPIRLVEVTHDGDTAQVSWEATTRAPFSYKGKERRPGEAVPLCSQLVRVDGLWKLLKFDQ